MQSMTGFGRSVAAASIGTLTTEMRSVNHRYCQVSLRLPSEFSEFEAQAVALVKSWAARGQVSVNVSFAPEADVASPRLRLDASLAERIVAESVALQDRLGVTTPLTMGDVLALPKVIVTNPVELDADERWSLLEQGLSDAWKDLAGMREREGGSLRTSIADGVARVSALRTGIAAEVPDLLTHYRERLEGRISELARNGHTIDEARIVMEAGLLADKADVSEELERLASHCDQMQALSDSTEPVGRQMDFLLQELHREANTIASKAANTAIISRCVLLKTEIERLREQCQNVE